MNEERLRRRLEDAAAPDEPGAERRGWAVVREAYAAAGMSRERRWPTRPVVALAVVLALGAAAFTPPGEAVAGWIRNVIEDDPRDAPRPALASLPTSGSLLVASEQGPWIVRADGSKRLLGAYDEAAWSPRGLHVAVTRGTRLIALTADGDVRWAITRRNRVSDPRWSPSGYRIAYRIGTTLHVVAGDSSPGRLLARRVAPVPAAWRPGAAHVLAYVDTGSRVNVVDADTRRRLWRSKPGCLIDAVAWSADGKRLVAASGEESRPLKRPVCAFSDRVFDASGRPLRNDGRALRFGLGAVAFAPAGHRLAYLQRTSGEGTTGVFVADSDRPLARRKLFETKADFRDLVWSPDGGWLLVTWPAADQWIFIRTSGSPKIVTISNVSTEFDPGGAGAAPFPSIAGWCCARYFR